LKVVLVLSEEFCFTFCWTGSAFGQALRWTSYAVLLGVQEFPEARCFFSEGRARFSSRRRPLELQCASPLLEYWVPDWTYPWLEPSLRAFDEGRENHQAEVAFANTPIYENFEYFWAA
jgi:hypothetical protein